MVSALGLEVAPLARRCGARRVHRTAALDLRSGRLADRELLVAVTGDGSGRARRGIEELLGLEPAGVVVIGVAGALSTVLELGDLVVARSVIGDGVLHPAPPSPWLAAFLGHPLAVEGRVLSVDRIAAGRDAKRALLETLPEGEPAVVDLESATYVHRLDEVGVPWVVARTVSDTAGEDLGLDFERFRGVDGSVRQLRVLAHGLLRPSRLRRLLELKRRVGLCAVTLARVLEDVVGRGAERGSGGPGPGGSSRAQPPRRVR